MNCIYCKYVTIGRRPFLCTFLYQYHRLILLNEIFIIIISMNLISNFDRPIKKQSRSSEFVLRMFVCFSEKKKKQIFDLILQTELFKWISTRRLIKFCFTMFLLLDRSCHLLLFFFYLHELNGFRVMLANVDTLRKLYFPFAGTQSFIQHMSCIQVNITSGDIYILKTIHMYVYCRTISCWYFKSVSERPWPASSLIHFICSLSPIFVYFR